jgi:hypothetical protein
MSYNHVPFIFGTQIDMVVLLGRLQNKTPWTNRQIGHFMPFYLYQRPAVSDSGSDKDTQILIFDRNQHDMLNHISKLTSQPF